jgi:hypothetical protein
MNPPLVHIFSQMFITVFTRTHHWFISSAKCSLPCLQEPATCSYLQPNVHYRVHKNQPLVHIFSQMFTTVFTGTRHWFISSAKCSLPCSQEPATGSYLQPNVHYRVHNNPPLVHIFSQMFTTVFIRTRHWFISSAKCSLPCSQEPATGSYFQPNVHYCLHKNPPLVHIFSQMFMTVFTRTLHWFISSAKCSLPCSQEPATGSYLQPNYSIPHPHTPFLQNLFLYYPSIDA